MSTNKVVCLKWGDKYSEEYVNKLYSMVQRNLTLPHEFICITDNPEGIQEGVTTQDCDFNAEGWWNKITVFDSRRYREGDKVVFLDLDVVITGNIDFLFTDREDLDFVGLLDFIYPDRTFNSSVLRFTAGKFDFILRQFRKASRMDNGNYKYQFKEYIGDQDIVTDMVYPNKSHKDKAFEEGKIVSYKRTVRHGGLLPTYKIVVFHGNPNPHEVTEGWVVSHWS